MQALYLPKAYPPKIKEAILAMEPQGLTREIANRWMLGWKKRVVGLIETGEYLPMLKSQVESEAIILAHAPSLQHLARHEIQEMYGTNPAPPTPSKSKAS